MTSYSHFDQSEQRATGQNPHADPRSDPTDYRLPKKDGKCHLWDKDEALHDREAVSPSSHDPSVKYSHRRFVAHLSER